MVQVQKYETVPISSPATELNDELAKWYMETINAFWNFFIKLEIYFVNSYVARSI